MIARCEEERKARANFSICQLALVFMGRAKTMNVRQEHVRRVCADDGYESWEGLDDLDLANMKIFGNKGFRHDQKEICELAVRSHNVLVLMPTGGGKSLCYQVRLSPSSLWRTLFF